jgi:FAD/FMN-containing dehydrogenase
VGDLVTSLYAAGRPEYRAGPADPAPGVASITAVMPRLDLRRLDQVVEVAADNSFVVAQGRCRLAGLAAFLSDRELTLASPPGPNPKAGTGAVPAAEAATLRASRDDLTSLASAAASSVTLELAAAGQVASRGAPAEAEPPAGGPKSVGAAVIAHWVVVLWVDVLTRSGQITRHLAGSLPPDALVVAAALATEPAAGAG